MHRVPSLENPVITTDGRILPIITIVPHNFFFFFRKPLNPAKNSFSQLLNLEYDSSSRVRVRRECVIEILQFV